MSKPVRLVFLADDSQLNSALRRLVTQTTATQAALKRLQRVGADMQRVGRGMTLGITLPVAAAAVASVKLASDFEESMTKIETLVGVSGDQVKRWGKDILELAPLVGKAPQELADSLYYITSSGAKASDALDILKVSARASAVGLGQTQVIANGVTSVINAYGSSTISAAKATDILIRAVGVGKGEPEEFAANLGQVLPIASELGVKFHDVAAAMAHITLKGDNASEAVTKIRGALSKLMRPTIQGNHLLWALGESTESVKQSLEKNGLLPTLQSLYDKIKQFSGMSVDTKVDIQKIVNDGGKLSAMQEKLVHNDFGANLATLFNDIRALQGVLSLTGESSGDVEKLFETVRGAGGDLDKAFGRTAETAAHKFKSAWAGMKASAIQVGQTLMPIATAIVEKVGHLIDAFAKLDPGVQKTIITVALLVATLGPLLWGLGSLAKIFAVLAMHPVLAAIGLLIIGLAALYARNETFRNGVNKVVGALADAARWIYENRTAVMALAAGLATFLVVGRVASFIKVFTMFPGLVGLNMKAILGFGKIVPFFGKAVAAMRAAWIAFNSAFLFSPIGIVIGIILALAVAFIVAYKNSETFRDFVHKAMEWVANAAKVAWAVIVEGAKEVWAWIGDYVVPVFKQLWEVAKTVFAAISSAISWAWENVIKPVFAAVEWYVSKILVPIFLFLWKNVIKPVWQGIQIAVSVAWAVIQVIFGLMQIYVKAVAAVYVWLWENIIRPIWDKITDKIGKAWEKIKEYWGYFKLGLKVIGDAVSEFWRDNIQPIWDKITDKIGKAWEKIKEYWGYFKLGLKVIGDAVSEFWRDNIQPIWDKVRLKILEVWEKVKEYWGYFKLGLEALKESFSKGVDSIGKIWARIQELAKAPVKFIIETILNNGILAGYNKLAKTFGVKPDDVQVPLPKGFSQGGVLDGYEPGVDRVPAMLSRGEGVAVPELVRKIGASRFLSWNRAARQGTNHQDFEHFSGGGIAGGISSLFSKARSAASSVFSGIKDFVSDPAGSLRSLAEKLYSTLPGKDTPFGQAALGVPRKIAAALVDKAKGMFSAGEAGGLGEGNVLGGYRGMERLISARFPHLRMISGFRPNSRTLSGNASYHGKGRAVDYAPDRALAAWIRSTYGAKTKELITPFQELNLHNGRPHRYTGAVWNQHNFAGGNAHVHWAARLGGIVPKNLHKGCCDEHGSVLGKRRQAAGKMRLHDSGGWIAPGDAGLNLSGKPEAVLTNEESRGLKAMLSSPQQAGVEVNIEHFHAGTQTPHEISEELAWQIRVAAL